MQLASTRPLSGAAIVMVGQGILAPPQNSRHAARALALALTLSSSIKFSELYIKWIN
jgi:hypothetical protein